MSKSTSPRRWRFLIAIVLLIATVLALVRIGVSLAVDSGEIITHEYPDLDSAREDQLFDRGWLPDILPPTAFNIRVSNNLDLNTSEGEFSLASHEWPAFQARLEWGPGQAPFEGWSDTVEKRREAGYSAWRYRDQNTVWTFFCHKDSGHCKYTMWMPRNG